MSAALEQSPTGAIAHQTAALRASPGRPICKLDRASLSLQSPLVKNAWAGLIYCEKAHALTYLKNVVPVVNENESPLEQGSGQQPSTMEELVSQTINVTEQKTTILDWHPSADYHLSIHSSATGSQNSVSHGIFSSLLQLNLQRGMMRELTQLIQQYMSDRLRNPIRQRLYTPAVDLAKVKPELLGILTKHQASELCFRRSKYGEAELIDIAAVKEARQSEEADLWAKIVAASSLEDITVTTCKDTGRQAMLNRTKECSSTNSPFGTTLEPTAQVTYTMSDVGRSKQQFMEFAEELWTVLWALCEYAWPTHGEFNSWTEFNAQTATATFVRDLHEDFLVPACKTIYTLHKFRATLDDFSMAFKPSLWRVDILLQIRALLCRAPKAALVDGFTLDGLNSLLDHLIGFLVKIELVYPCTNNWRGEQTWTLPSDAGWLNAGKADPRQISFGATSIVTTESLDPLIADTDVANPVDQVTASNEKDKDTPVAHDDDSDSVCSEASVTVTMNVCDNYRAKPNSVCKWWVATYHRKYPDESTTPGQYLPQNCVYEKKIGNHIQPCGLLHPNMSRPGLCPKWLKNDCHDIDCRLAHDDPLYPRNMHVADIPPSMLPVYPVVCKFWQRDICQHGDNCKNAHHLPNGQSKYQCAFWDTDNGCRNLNDRCDGLHDYSAPKSLGTKLRYYGYEIDPLAPPDQPDRRPLANAQRTSGGGMRILCWNMAQNGTCWRGDQCWLEHDLTGVQVTYNRDPRVPDTLTIPQRCEEWPSCNLDDKCPKHHPGPNKVDICPFYYKFGSCRFRAQGTCRHKAHIRADEEAQKTGTKRQAPGTEEESRKRQKPEPKAEKLHKNQVPHVVPTQETTAGSGRQSTTTVPSPGLQDGNANKGFAMKAPSTPNPIPVAQVNPQRAPSGGIFPFAQAQCINEDSAAHARGPYINPGSHVSSSNQASQFCHYCGVLGHVQRDCAQKRHDDTAKARGNIAIPPTPTPSMYGHQQGAFPFKQQQQQQPIYATPQMFSSPFTPFSSQSPAFMPWSTPMTPPSPLVQYPSGSNHGLRSNQPIYGMRPSSGYGSSPLNHGLPRGPRNRYPQQSGNAQLYGTPTPAPQSISGRAYPPGPPRAPLADRIGADNSAQGKKRKFGDHVNFDTPASKRQKPGKCTSGIHFLGDNC